MLKSLFSRRLVLGLLFALAFGTSGSLLAQNGGTVTDSTRIRFTSPESYTLFANNAFTAQVAAYNRAGSSIAYSIRTNIDTNKFKGFKPATGMTIDSASGNLSWTAVAGGNYIAIVKAYDVNSTTNYTEKYLYFTVLDTTKCATIFAHITDKSTGLPINNATFSASLLNNQNNSYGFYSDSTGANGLYSVETPKGSYYIYVTASGYESYTYSSSTKSYLEVKCGDVDTINISLELKKFIKFTNDFTPDTITIGDTVRKTFTVNSSSPSDVRFYLNNKSITASFDSLTGALTWTPSQTGNYELRVTAYLSNTNITTSETWRVVVLKVTEKPCATIQGKVIDKATNLAIAGAGITIYALTDNNSVKTSYQVKSDSNGYYSAMVIAGRYIVIAHKDPYTPVYYPAQSPNDSTSYFTVVCGDNDTINFSLEGKKFIEITSHPSQMAYNLGDTISYKFTAIASDSTQIRFSAERMPNGATIDSLTGIFNWIANVGGSQSIKVKAYLANATSIYSLTEWNFYVIPAALTPCAVIKGRVRDSSGAPIANAFVQVSNPFTWRHQGNTYDSLYYQYVLTDSNGAYSFNLPASQYWVFAQSPWKAAKYYTNNSDSERTTITLACGDTIEANFVFKVLKAPTKYTVSGNVTAETTLTPLKSKVTFIYINNDSTKYNKQDRTVKAETDSNGYYSIALEEGSYKILVEPKSKDYFAEFYSDASDISSATAVSISANSVYNFALAAKPTYVNKFSGYLQDSAGVKLSGLVVAFKFDSNTTQYYSATSITSDSNTGYFEFNNIEPGSYYLYAVPDSFSYASGYYKENAYAVYDWANATMVTVVNNVTNPNTITIMLQACKRHHGIGGIHGKVFHHGKKIKAVNGILSETTSLSGVLMTAINADGAVVGNAITDENGEYSFDGLDYGSVTIQASKLGYVASANDLALDPENVSVENTDITLSPLGTTGVEENTTVVSSDMVYPNPVVSSATFSSSDNIVEIRIVDNLGRQVANYQVNSNQFSFDASAFATGSYHAMLIKNSSVQFVSFQVVK